MKRGIGFLVITVAFIHSMSGQELSKDIAFEERVYNFGKIKEAKGKVSHTFVFQNKGKKPVTISEINSACGCIGKAVTAGAVQPGGKGKVTITFDPGYKSGFFSKEIVVLSNDNQQYNRIWVEGVVEPAEHPIEDDYPYNFGNGLHLRLKVMAFGYLKPGQTKEMELHYASGSDKEINLNFKVTGNNPGLKFINPGKIGPKKRGVVKFSYTMPVTSQADVVIMVSPTVNDKIVKEKLELRILNQVKFKQDQQQAFKKASDINTEAVF